LRDAEITMFEPSLPISLKGDLVGREWGKEIDADSSRKGETWKKTRVRDRWTSQRRKRPERSKGVREHGFRCSEREREVRAKENI